MCGPAVAAAAPIISAVVGVASAVNSYQQGRKADKRAKAALAETKKANADTKASSEAALAAQERDMNRRNAKSPNVAAILASNNQATANQTLLTGPGGVNSNSLQLGRNTLLGA